MFEVLVRQNRTRDFTGSVYDASGTGVVLQAGDKLRFKIADGLASPILDIKSGTPSANGSSITVLTNGSIVGNVITPATYKVRIAQADSLNVTPGAYDAEVLLVDDEETSPADAAKTIDVGVIYILQTISGPVSI